MTGIVFPDIAGSILPIMQMERMRQQDDLAAARQRKLDADQERLDSAGQYLPGALKGEPEAFANLARVHPALAVQLRNLADQKDHAAMQKAAEGAKFLASSAGAVIGADPADRPAAYEAHLQALKQRGLDVSTLPPTYTPGLDATLRYQRDTGIHADKWLEMQQQGIGPAPGSGAPVAPGATGAAGNAIGGIESQGGPNGGYGAIGPAADAKGSRAYGKYQVMDYNVPTWTAEALGQPMTPQQFLANPQAQDAVFNHKFGQYTQKYGPEGAAKAWFAGEGGMNNPNARDVNGMTVAKYGQQFAANSGAGMPQSALGPPAGGMVDPGAVIPQGGGDALPGQPGTMPQKLLGPKDPFTSDLDLLARSGYVKAGHNGGPTKGQPVKGPTGGVLYINQQTGDSIEYKPGFEDVRQNPADPNSPIIAQRNLATNELHPKNMAGQIAIPPELANVRGDALKATPWYQSQSVTLRNNAEGLVSGDLPISTLSKRAGGGADFNTTVALAQQLQPGWSPNEGVQRQIFDKSLADGNSRNGQSVQAINIAPSHGADLVKITDAMNQNNPQAVQGIINKLKAQFGDTAVPTMEAARNIVGLEMLKAAVGPANMNQMLEEKFLGSLSSAATADQTRALVRTYVKLLEDRANEMIDTGKIYNVPDIEKKIIHPRTQEALDYLKGPRIGAPGTPQAGQPVAAQPSLWDRVFGGTPSPTQNGGPTTVRKFNPATGALE